MRYLISVLLLAVAALAQTPAPAPTAPAAPKMVKYYMGFLKKGPNWNSPPPAAELQELGKAHIGHLVSMHKAGKLVLAGPFGDNGDIRGILIFKGTDSMDEMKALAEQDPMVKSGRMMVEIHPWYVEDGYLPK